MKKSETINIRFTELNQEELDSISGGSFAYDLGRAIRFMSIYLYEGTGIRGYCCATADFAANIVMNS